MEHFREVDGRIFSLRAELTGGFWIPGARIIQHDERLVTGSALPVRFISAALLAVLGPWLVGMSFALSRPDHRWSVAGEGGFVFGVLYLMFFGGVSAWIAGSHQIAIGALAGEAFALGSLGRGGGVVGAVIALGAGLAGGWIAMRVEAESPPSDKDPRRHPRNGPQLVFLIAIGFGLPLALISYGRIAGGAAVTAALYAVVLVSTLLRAKGSRLLIVVFTAAVVAVLGIAWGSAVAANEDARIANRRPPLEQVLRLTRSDGMSFGDFVRIRYAHQLSCSPATVIPQYTVFQQGPVVQANGESVFFHEIIFWNGSSTCPRASGFFIAVFAESVPPRITGDVLVRDCTTRRRMGEAFTAGSNCRAPISVLKPGFVEGEPSAVDWLSDFRRGETP